jgi:hypothetical protein
LRLAVELFRRYPLDVITINDEEASASGEYSLKAAAKIQTMYPKYASIKKGEHGALLFHNKEVFFVQLYPLEEVLTQQEQAILQVDLQVITERKHLSIENMKTLSFVVLI